ncbi:plasmid pRiA4b ORF-3 family protein [Mycobacterium spongiae]|uniref:Plasmid pRiA4b ORF-3 family protein n=1 Tax=Mycobacterium spongiae TaxID=886343 RepID=A0A975K1C9_9MYCO|nr:plasmid pRiA4b ORF-3 family protein [Mycobacterium spongiae]QUR69572.1 plasmid pRiA4b ORF-3 family protein [Mycobacterium spongiae]
MKTTRLQVVLRGVEPAVTRVIDVPASATLPELHDLLQAAVGWTDSHLHQFVTQHVRYGSEPPADAAPEYQRDENDARLTDLGLGFEYHYDMGDGWIHDVTVLGRGDATPGCVRGDGSCPPEDCGGPSGYAELLDVLGDPTNPEHHRMRDWVGNRLHPFNHAATDQWVRRVVGAVPASVRLLLDFTADGIKLTSGGRLPTAVVLGMQEHRPQWHPLGSPTAIEDDLRPLVALHRLLRGVGLLRLHRGVLASTRAAGDDLAVVRRIRSAFEPDTLATEITELTIGVLAVHGSLTRPELAARVHERLGPRSHPGGDAVTERDVQIAIGEQSPIMRGLDLIDDTEWRTWSVGASARSLLPRATMLTETWTNE